MLNPIAREKTGVNPTVRREVLYALADIKSVENHYLLKVANIIDRALRAPKARIQKTIQKYLRNKGCMPKMEQNYTTKIEKISEPFMETSTKMQQREITAGRANRKKQTWWILESAIGQEEGMPQPKRTSIFRAQAEELRTEEGATEKLIFQYEGLHNWMDVGIKVLKATGWQSSCVYEENLFPPQVTYKGKNWGRLMIESTTQEQISEKERKTEKKGEVRKRKGNKIEM